MGYDDTDSEDERVKASDEAGEVLVNMAADAALSAAVDTLGEDHVGPQTRILVVIDQIAGTAEDEQDCTSAVAKGDETPATIGDVMEMCLGHAMNAARAAGKELKLVPVEQHTPEMN